jgi:hypothetical protein
VERGGKFLSFLPRTYHIQNNRILLVWVVQSQESNTPPAVGRHLNPARLEFIPVFNFIDKADIFTVFSQE